MPALLIVLLVVGSPGPSRRPGFAPLSVCSVALVRDILQLRAGALIFFGIFAIDLKTGAHDGGFLHCWKRAREEDADRHSTMLMPEAQAA